MTGTVRNEIERDLAGEIAKGVEGVKKVNNNNNKLEMKPEARRDAGRGSFARSVEDANITAMVKSRLLLDLNTHGLTIHGTTKMAS